MSEIKAYESLQLEVLQKQSKFYKDFAKNF